MSRKSELNRIRKQLAQYDGQKQGLLHTVVLCEATAENPPGRRIEKGRMTITFDPQIGPGQLPPSSPPYKICFGSDPITDV